MFKNTVRPPIIDKGTIIKLVKQIKHIFNKECHRPQELLVLLRNKNMINFFSDLAPLFLLFPTSDDFDCDSFFPEQIATQHFDTNEQPTDNYMLTLSAQIITVLCDYMPQMLKNVSMSEAYEIFAYHFSIIISIFLLLSLAFVKE